MAKSRKQPKAAGKVAQGYTHPDKTVAMRPEIGTQSQFRKKKPPVTYRYDSSLSPTLEWDGQNPSREQGEALIRKILDAPDIETAKNAARELQAMSKPFLNWAGKAERLSFDVPTLPLFVHERLSTKAIVETLKGHKSDKQTDFFDLLGDPHHSFTDQVLKAYEHADQWVNRLILGDSLVVMNSLLHYEGLGGQVQMIYIDPPYGVKFGSNFQPFVRKRDVSHGDDEDLTREPEMVKAYRDTWELGLHSYLTYMRDRLLLARELLTSSGSVFVQISDENLHHVRELMDESFGAENFVGLITFKKTSGAGSPALGTEVLASVSDYLVWYARDREHVKFRQTYLSKGPDDGGADQYTWLELADGTRRRMSKEERDDFNRHPPNSRVFRADNLTGQSGVEKTKYPVDFDGRVFTPSKGVWKTSAAGMQRLKERRRLILVGDTLSYVRYLDDFVVRPTNNFWDDTVVSGFGDTKLYAVQTSSKVLQRCILMTTDPGDLILDPTCGSGTTAYVAEQWGRRWITIDTSRVPLALARQRLLTATFPFYELKEPSRGPSGGFGYKRKKNAKGEEVGGIVPHVTLKSIANDEPPDEEVLVDRPEIDNSFIRVTGPFVVEATIPTPVDMESGTENLELRTENSEGPDEYATFVERMIEVLRRAPVLHVGGGKTVQLANIRPPAKSLSLSAEGVSVNGDQKQVAFVFGPENGAISEKLVQEALKEASLKHYTHLYVIGFAIQPHARQLVDHASEMGLLPATYVQATPDLMMGDLLKNMRSSQIFSVCGLPDVDVHPIPKSPDSPIPRFEVELAKLNVFDPTTLDTYNLEGKDVPCWMLDTDYNNMCFRASQVFFPRTSAWESLKKALKADYDETVWDHLAGTRSAPFEAGEHKQVAVKVIDDRGNELLVVKPLP